MSTILTKGHTISPRYIFSYQTNRDSTVHNKRGLHSYCSYHVVKIQQMQRASLYQLVQNRFECSIFEIRTRLKACIFFDGRPMHAKNAMPDRSSIA